MLARVQAYANNELRVTVASPPRIRKGFGDKFEERKRERIAQALERAEVAQRILGNEVVEQVGVRVKTSVELEQLHLWGQSEVIAAYTTLEPEYARYVSLADERPNGSIGFVHRPSIEIEAERDRALDIFRDSQETGKTPSWHKSPRTDRGFGKEARHRLLEAGAVIDRAVVVPGGQAWMLTLTIPGSCEDGFRAVAQYSGWIQNRLAQVIRDESRSQGEFYWFYVWELQRRGALHMHYCLAHPVSACASALSYKLKDKWYDLLVEVEEKTGTDLFAKNSTYTHRDKPENWQWNIQECRKSVAAYFSKYSSKSESKGASSLKNGCPPQFYVPARWWGSSRTVKRLIEEWRLEAILESLDEAEAEALHHEFVARLPMEHCIKEVSWEYEIESDDPAHPYAYGRTYAYWFRPDYWEEIHALVSRLTAKRVIRRIDNRGYVVYKRMSILEEIAEVIRDLRVA